MIRNVSLNLKLGGMAYKAVCKWNCFRTLIFKHVMALQSSVNQVLILMLYLEIGKSLLKSRSKNRVNASKKIT